MLYEGGGWVSLAVSMTVKNDREKQFIIDIFTSYVFTEALLPELSIRVEQLLLLLRKSAGHSARIQFYLHHIHVPDFP